MEAITEGQLQQCAETIDYRFPLDALTSPIFSDSGSRANFNHALVDMSRYGIKVVIRGRSLRQLLGFGINDQAASISSDAVFDTQVLMHDAVRCSHFSHLLRRDFPTERLTKHDLDIHVSDGKLEEVQAGLVRFDVPSTLTQAVNGVRVLEVKTDTGEVVFCQTADSWQSKTPWPKLGTVHARVANDLDDPHVAGSTHWGNLHLYPLACPGIGVGEYRHVSNPVSFAAIARALLWSCTLTRPENSWETQITSPQTTSDRPIRMPMEGYRPAMYTAVSAFLPLLRRVREKTLPEASYYSAFRDMATALWIIVPDFNRLDAFSRDDFFSNVYSNYCSSWGTNLTEEV